jgi:hypothetical protein
MKANVTRVMATEHPLILNMLDEYERQNRH